MGGGALFLPWALWFISDPKCLPLALLAIGPSSRQPPPELPLGSVSLLYSCSKPKRFGIKAEILTDTGLIPIGAVQDVSPRPGLLVLEAHSQDDSVTLDRNPSRVSKCFSFHNRSSVQSRDGNMGSRAMGIPHEGLAGADINSGRGG